MSSQLEKYTDRETDLAKAVMSGINCMAFDANAFVEIVMREHRTLQQSLFLLFMACVTEWAKQEHFDARNQYTVEKSREIVKLFDGCARAPFI